MKRCKPSKICSKAVVDVDALEPNASDTNMMRRGVGKIQFGVQEMSEIRFALRQCASRASKGNALTIGMLKLLMRYLQGQKECWQYLTVPIEELPKELLVWTDADWAGDSLTRKSYSCNELPTLRRQSPCRRRFSMTRPHKAPDSSCISRKLFLILRSASGSCPGQLPDGLDRREKSFAKKKCKFRFFAIGHHFSFIKRWKSALRAQ